MRSVLCLALFPSLVFAGPLKVGLLGQASSAQAKAFAGFVQKATGDETTAVGFADYDGLADALADGKVDVGFMPPIAVIRAEVKSKPLPILTVVRKGQSTYRSVLFVGAASKLKSLNDLRAASGLKVAWVDPSSATGYIFPKASLIVSKIDPVGLFVSQDFLGSHDAVCAAVAGGKADVGATFTDDPINAAGIHATGCGRLATSVRVIAATQSIPNDALVLRANFPDASRDALLKAGTALATTADGKKWLAAAFLGEALVQTSSADYTSARQALDAFHK